MSSNTKAHKETGNSTNCTFTYILESNFSLSTSTALILVQDTLPLTFPTITVFYRATTYGLFSTQQSETSCILFNMLLTSLGWPDLLCTTFCFGHPTSAAVVFLKILTHPWSVPASEPLHWLSLPTMLWRDAWLTPSYPLSFCANAVYSVMPTLPQVSQSPYLLDSLPQHLVPSNMLYNSFIYSIYCLSAPSRI